MKKYTILKWIVFGLAVAINLFIIINALINGEASAQESNKVAHTTADIINEVKPETITKENFPSFALAIRKLFGHYGLFVVSGLLSSWSFYLFLKDTKVGYFLYQIGFTLLFGFVIAAISEFAQMFVEGRYGTWKDVGIDFLGYFTGFSLIFLILLIRKSKIFWKKNYMKNQAE